jgi:hypothetical protein
VGDPERPLVRDQGVVVLHLADEPRHRQGLQAQQDGRLVDRELLDHVQRRRPDEPVGADDRRLDAVLLLREQRHDGAVPPGVGERAADDRRRHQDGGHAAPRRRDGHHDARRLLRRQRLARARGEVHAQDAGHERRRAGGDRHRPRGRARRAGADRRPDPRLPPARRRAPVPGPARDDGHPGGHEPRPGDAGRTGPARGAREAAQVLDIGIVGNPALQKGDLVSVDDPLVGITVSGGSTPSRRTCRPTSRTSASPRSSRRT